MARAEGGFCHGALIWAASQRGEGDKALVHTGPHTTPPPGTLGKEPGGRGDTALGAPNGTAPSGPKVGGSWPSAFISDLIG